MLVSSRKMGAKAANAARRLPAYHLQADQIDVWYRHHQAPGQTQAARRDAFMHDIFAHYGNLNEAMLNKMLVLPGGKPALITNAAAPLYFSISHTPNVSAIAITTGGPVGIDIEPIRKPHLAPVLTKAISTRDRVFLTAWAKRAGMTFDLAAWLTIEALSKQHGAGLRLLDGRAPRLEVASAAKKRLLHLHKRNQYAVAVAGARPAAIAFRVLSY